MVIPATQQRRLPLQLSIANKVSNYGQHKQTEGVMEQQLAPDHLPKCICILTSCMGLSTVAKACVQLPALRQMGLNTLTKVYMHVTGGSTPQRFLLIADWGLSQNSSVTLQHILLSAANTTSAPAVLYIADFCYAGQSLPGFPL